MYRENVRDLRADIIKEIYDRCIFDIDSPELQLVLKVIEDVFKEYLL